MEGSSLTFLFIVVLFLGHTSSAEKAERVTEPLKPTRSYHHGASSVFAYDNVLGKNLLRASSNLVKMHATWFFVHPDPYEGIQNQNNGDLHWIAPFSPKAFAESRIWKGLQKGLSGAGIFDGKELYPYNIEGVMLLRGFSPAVYKGKNDGDIYFRIFLTKGFKKNDYSELIFYNENEEIFASIFPKYGRVVVWNDTSDFIFRPPSFNVEQGEYSLLIKVTEDESKFIRHEEKFQLAKKEYQDRKSKEFPFTNRSSDDIYEINLAEHLTTNFTDSTNRIVAVFDNVVPKDELDSIRSYFMKLNSAYHYDGYDSEFAETNDNVNWIVKINPLTIRNSRLWHYVHHCASYLSGENQWFPYDVAMNIIQHSHHTRIHADCAENEHEYTFLMYLSPGWSEERYGETIFVEKTKNGRRKTQNSGNEKYNTLGAVIPKYGRIVIFRNIIDHSARPPSPDFLAARYTFAVKVGRSPEIAIAKALREKLDMHTESPKAVKLQEDIYGGKYDVYNDPKTEKFLRKKFKMYEDLSTKMQEDDKQRTYELLRLKEHFN